MVYYLDYAAGTLGGQTIKQAGYGGTIRYVTSPALMQPPNPGNPKHITRSEYESHLAAGLDVWLVYQGTTTDADGGYEIGRRNAFRAVEGCLNENHSSRRQGPIGYNGPIFFTNDRTTLPSPSSWRQYLDGAASVIGIDRVGAYGFGNAMDAAVGHANYFWQAGRRRDVRNFVHFWQDNNTQVTVGGKLCDRNLVLKVLNPPPPPPVDPPVEEEPDMQLTDVIGHRENGTPITVGDALKEVMSIDSKINSIRSFLELEIQASEDRLENRITEIGTLPNQTTTWGDLETKTWSELETSTWGKIN